MDKIFNAYTAAKGRTLRGDFTDQLHSSYTVTMFLGILLLLVSKQYSGSAIACWLPKQFTGDQENYIHQFCWINNTYYYPSEKDPDRFGPTSDKYVIHYYQFILFILSGQIMLFFLPSLLWKTIASDSGSYINKLLDSLDRTKVFQHEISKAEEPEVPKFPLRTVSEDGILDDSVVSQDIQKRPFLSNQMSEQFRNDFQHLKTTMSRSSSKKDSMKKVSYDGQPSNTVDMKHVDSIPSVNFSVDLPEKKSKSKSLKKGLKKKLGKVIVKPIRGVKNLALFYLGMKFFNIFNVLAQLIGLRFIFGEGFWRYGFDYMTKIFNNEDPLFMSKQFPIVTICDYYVHQNLRRIHWNSSQCLLAINVLIEKFYVFIWLWLYILLGITTFNVISWFLEMYPSTRTGFILKYLRIKEKMHESSHSKLFFQKSITNKKDYDANDTMLIQSNSHVSKQNVELFHKEYLGNDGIVMMHIVRGVSGDIIFMELLNSLWDEFIKRKFE